MIKYYILPGYVHSKYDNDVHYINAYALIRLYNVNIKDCKILNPNDERTPRFIQEAESKGIKILTPRYHGDYNV